MTDWIPEKIKEDLSTLFAIALFLAVVVYIAWILMEMNSISPGTGSWPLLFFVTSLPLIPASLCTFAFWPRSKRYLPLVFLLVGLLILSQSRMRSIGRILANYEKEVEAICSQATRAWTRAGGRSDQYRATEDVWLFVSDRHRFWDSEAREELMQSGGHVQKAVAYVEPTYEVVGHYVGLSAGRKAAIVTWAIYLVDMDSGTVTAHAVFRGPPPPEEIGSRPGDSQSEYYAQPPWEEYKEWLASLPVRPCAT